MLGPKIDLHIVAGDTGYVVECHSVVVECHSVVVGCHSVVVVGCHNVVVGCRSVVVGCHSVVDGILGPKNDLHAAAAAGQVTSQHAGPDVLAAVPVNMAVRFEGDHSHHVGYEIIDTEQLEFPTVGANSSIAKAMVLGILCVRTGGTQKLRLDRMGRLNSEGTTPF